MKTYRQLEDELSTVLERVENATYEELDDLLKDYDKGMKIITELQKKLQSAQNSIKKVNPK